MTGLAWAADAPAAAGGMGAIAQFVPLILIFVVFYFLLIRPQQKKAKEHQNYLANLKKGDKVITGGGIHGQIAENVRIKVNRGAIAGSAADLDKQAPAKAGG